MITLIRRKPPNQKPQPLPKKNKNKNKKRRGRRRRKTIASHPFLCPVSMLRLQCTFSFVSTPNDGKQLKVNEEIFFLFVSPLVQLTTDILVVFCELCRIGIEGAKSRCRGRPLLIQICKSFLTLSLSMWCEVKYLLSLF